MAALTLNPVGAPLPRGEGKSAAPVRKKALPEEDPVPFSKMG